MADYYDVSDLRHTGGWYRVVSWPQLVYGRPDGFEIWRAQAEGPLGRVTMDWDTKQGAILATYIGADCYRYASAEGDER